MEKITFERKRWFDFLKINLDQFKSFLNTQKLIRKKISQIKLILGVKKSSSKMTRQGNLAIKEKRSRLVIQIIQNILIKNLQIMHPQILMEKSLNLIKRKNSKIEKDQTIFHLKNLEENKLVSKTIIY